MKAALFTAVDAPLEITELAVDRPRPREALVRVAASSLCHSDMHIMHGGLPHATPAVIGHEAAGIVEGIGSEVQSLSPGDHVVCCASIFCGTCDPCLSGHSNRCADRPGRKGEDRPTLTFAETAAPLSQHGAIGGFAEKMLIHENGLVKVPKALPLDRAALLGCGVMSGAGAVFNAARVQPGASVAVIGAGGVGLNVIQAARIAGARQIIAVDINPAKFDLAMKLGATDIVEAGEDTVEAVRQISEGGVDHSFEVVGLQQTIEQAVHILRPGGMTTVVGVTGQDVSFSVPAVAMLWNEWKVQGSRLGSGPFKRDIPMFAALYLQGHLDLDSLIGERIQLQDINEGFARMAAGHQGRSVILFDEVMEEAAANAAGD